MKKVIIVLAKDGYEHAEVALPWRYFKDAGFEVAFGTEDGMIGNPDFRMMKGFYGFVLSIFDFTLFLKPNAVKAFYDLKLTKEFRNPIKFGDINVNEFDAIVITGGHEKSCRSYYESKELQQKVLEFYKANKIIGCICHGGLIIARTIDPVTNKSIIHGKKVTCFPKGIGKLAYYSTFLYLGDYFKLYPEFCEDTVKKALRDKKDFKKGLLWHVPFVLEDGNLITSRWPRDTHLFSKRLTERIKRC